MQKKSDGKDGLDVAALKRTLVTIQDLTVALDKLKWLLECTWRRPDMPFTMELNLLKSHLPVIIPYLSDQPVPCLWNRRSMLSNSKSKKLVAHFFGWMVFWHKTLIKYIFIVSETYHLKQYAQSL